MNYKEVGITNLDDSRHPLCEKIAIEDAENVLHAGYVSPIIVDGYKNLPLQHLPFLAIVKLLSYFFPSLSSLKRFKKYGTHRIHLILVGHL